MNDKISKITTSIHLFFIPFSFYFDIHIILVLFICTKIEIYT